jgi:hypothetical protein
MRASIISMADPNAKPVIQYKKRDTRDQNFRNLELLRSEVIPQNMTDEQSEQKQRRNSNSTEVRHMSVTGNWGIFNPFIKNTAEPEAPLPSLKKQVDLKSNNANILISKNKTYKNEKEVIIVNKKRNMSMVRSILSNANAVNDHTGKKSIKLKSQNEVRPSKAYCSDYYDFNIDKDLIEKYKKNQEEPWNNSSNFNFNIIVDGSASNFYSGRKSAIDEYNQKRMSTVSLSGNREENKFYFNNKDPQFHSEKNITHLKYPSNKNLPDFTSNSGKEISSKSIHTPITSKFSSSSTQLGSSKPVSNLANINYENQGKLGGIVDNSLFKEDYYNKLKKYSILNNSISNFHPGSATQNSKADIFNHNLIKIRPDPLITEKLKNSSPKGITKNIELVPETSQASPLTIKKIPLIVPTKRPVLINAPISSRASQEASGSSSFHKSYKNINLNSNNISNGIKSEISNTPKIKNKMYHMMEVFTRRPSNYKNSEKEQDLSNKLDISVDLNNSKEIQKKDLKKKISSSVKTSNNSKNIYLVHKDTASYPNSTNPFNTKTCSQENFENLNLNSQNTITEGKNSRVDVQNTMEEYLDKNFNLYLKEDLFKNNVISKFVETLK